MSDGILPDEWDAVSAYRNRKYQLKSLQELRAHKIMLDTCSGCPALRIYIVSYYGDEWVVPSCVFFNKCIKQYPHRIDNKEFT